MKEEKTGLRQKEKGRLIHEQETSSEAKMNENPPGLEARDAKDAKKAKTQGTKANQSGAKQSKRNETKEKEQESQKAKKPKDEKTKREMSIKTPLPPSPIPQAS